MKKVPQFIIDQNGQRIRSAEFKGGVKGWKKYLDKKIKYSEDAEEKGIQEDCLTVSH